MRLRLAACPRRFLLLGAVLVSLTTPFVSRAIPVSADFISNNGSGAAPWETFTTINLGAGLHANIHAADGNLLLNVDGLSLPGVNGLNETVELHYNSLSHNITQSVGYGWLMGTAQDVGLEFGPSSVTFYDETGRAYIFNMPSSCVFTPEDGDDATLACSGSGYTLTKNASQLQYQFDGNGMLSALQNRQGNRITFGYNGADTLAQVITNTEGQTTTLSYNSSNNLSQITDPAGRKWQYGYDSSGNLTSIINPRNKTITFSYDSSHRLTQITDPNGNVTLYAYGPNTLGSTSAVTQTVRVTNTVTNVGATWGFAYNTGSTQVTDPNSHATTYGYDSSQRVTSIEDAENHTTNLTWTGDNHLASVKLPSGATTTYSYDSLNNLTKVSLPTGAHSDWQYGNSSLPYNVTVFTDTQGNATSYQYNSQGLVTHVTDAATHLITNTYNSDGTLASVQDANGHTTSYGYNSLGLLNKITYPSPLGAYSFVYHSYDLLETQTDGKGQTSTFSYNGNSQPITITYADSSAINYGYDADGNRTSLTDGTGTTNYSYNALSQQTQQTLPNSATTNYTWDGVNSLLTKVDSGGAITYTYSPANHVTSVTDPQGAKTTLGYDQDSNRTSIAYPNTITETMGYNGARELAGITATNSSGGVVDSFAYSYTNPGTGLATTLRYGVVDSVGNSTTYSYDALNRLTQALEKNSGGTTVLNDSYGYDPMGNMTSQTLNGTGTTMTYNAANELTAAGSTTFSYDGNGNLTGSSAGLGLGYNALNQTSVITPAGGSAIPYTYTDQGQPLRVGAGSTTYQNDITGLSAMTTVTGTTYFTRLPDGTLLSERSANGTDYYLTDAQSVVHLTSATGGLVASFSYDPYGNNTGGFMGVANPFQFDGQLLDQATGYYKMGARYYGPTGNRWTQEDSRRGCPSNPQSLNRYPFVGNDPIDYVDPAGTDFPSCFIGCVSQANAAIGITVSGLVGGVCGAVCADFPNPPGCVACLVGVVGIGGILAGCAGSCAAQCIFGC